MQNDNGNNFMMFLTGLAIGTGLGVLFAPDKGTETRKKIKGKALDAKADIQVNLSHAKEELKKTVEEKKEDFEEKLDDAISNMSLKADDIINALEHKLEVLKKKNAQLQK